MKNTRKTKPNKKHAIICAFGVSILIIWGLLQLDLPLATAFPTTAPIAVGTFSEMMRR